jgi:NAD-dependent SIR2 family protein deacetylase
MSYASIITVDDRTAADELAHLRSAFDEADAILIGAGAGFSTAAGFTYSGPRFERTFSPWRERYGFTDMYSGGFYPYPTLQDFWGYWCKSILVNRYECGVGAVYRTLVDLVADRDAFVLTTNVDHQFQLSGADHARLFYTQGDYGLFQCSKPCRPVTYDNEEQVRAMASALDEKIARQKAAGVPARLLDLSVPAELVPRCPHCGRPLTTNLRIDDTFVEDEGWHAASARYHAWLDSHETGRVLYLELGVGGNTPGIIKYPFWQRAARNPAATYACVNFGEAYAPAQIADRAIVLDADCAAVVDALAGTR